MSSWHSNSNFANHFAIHWSLCKVLIERLHNNSHQKKKNIYYKWIFFAKLVRLLKSKEQAKFELEYLLLIFIDSNSNLT